MAKQARPIFIPGTNMQFTSASAAAKALGINAGNIYSVLAGRRQTAGGYQFGYASNRTIYIPETGQAFTDIKSAARSVGVGAKKAIKGLEGRSGSAIGGYHFTYADASRISPPSPAGTVSTVPARTQTKKRKTNKQERLQAKRQKKQQRYERQQQKKSDRKLSERNQQYAEQQRQEAKQWQQKKQSDKIASKISELKNLLSGINNQLEQYYDAGMMGYSRAAQDVAEFQNYLGGTNDGLFDLSDENIQNLIDTMSLDEIATWMKQIKDEIKSKNAVFWDLQKQIDERDLYAAEFGIAPGQLDDFVDLLPDLWDVLKIANTKQKKGSKQDGTWDSIRDAIQGTITRKALQDLIENLRKFWNGDRARDLKAILSDLEQYRAKSSPISEDIDENNLPF